MRVRSKQRRIPAVIAFVGLVLAGGQLPADDSPWYVAARFGDADVEARLGSQPVRRIDGEDGAAAVEVGYALNRHLAVEFGYQDLGRHTGTGSPCTPADEVCIQRLASLGLCVEGFSCTEVYPALEADVDGFSLALVPSLPIGKRLSLRGKAGVIAWDTDVVVAGGSIVPASGSRTTRDGELFSSRDLLAGVGVQYSFPSGLGVLLQHETFDLDAETTSLGVSWRF